MRNPNKITRIIKDNSGASIIFVLGIALLLLLISTSALVAASANMGASIAKQNRAQLNLYADSVQKAILSSLMSDEDSGKNVLATELTTLHGQILREIYNQTINASKSSMSPIAVSFATELSFENLSDIQVTLDSSDSELDCTVDLFTGNFSKAFVMVDKSSTPTSIMINARLTVKAEVGHREATLTSLATYDYVGGLIEIDEDDVKIVKLGKWGFISYEKVDN